ncbi:MAG: ComEA family DNA-binding protein [Kyrpidia sp.]|nr:ComEA family DNA-binding protein [Kyrpidia sp.]
MERAEVGGQGDLWRQVRRWWWALPLLAAAGAAVWLFGSGGPRSDAEVAPAAVDVSVIAGKGPQSSDARQRTIAVDVKGAVRSPGVYQLAPGSRVKEAVEAAGGVLESGRLDGINLAAKLEDGGMVVVPGGPAGGNAPVSGSHAAVAASPPAAGDGNGGSPVSGGVVHLNSGSVEEIDRLPGIGKSKAEAIVRYRQEHGPFPSVDRLRDVPGIGPKLLERIRSRVDLQ